MSGLYSGSIDTVQRVPVGKQDHRTGREYHDALVDEAERSLMRSPRWRAGQPLEDHRDACDCPLTLAGCRERRAWPSSEGLGSRSGVPASRALDRREANRLEMRRLRQRQRNGGQP